MNKTLKEKIEDFAMDYSTQRALINILNNIICGYYEFSDSDVATFCCHISEMNNKLSKNLDEIEVDLKI